MKPRIALASAALLALVGALAAAGCGTKWDRRDPTGERLPSMVGETLSGVSVRLPEEFAGKPVLLLVGYEQNTQFDLDRWLLALDQAGVDVAVREVPTIPGLLPGVFAGAIDAGMRRGIPQEDWGAVVTLYADAGDMARFTGNRDGLPGRVLLLDGDGRVAWFHDRGFSVGSLRALERALSAMRGD